jgi:hypothetical protein
MMLEKFMIILLEMISTKALYMQNMCLCKMINKEIFRERKHNYFVGSYFLIKFNLINLS